MIIAPPASAAPDETCSGMIPTAAGVTKDKRAIEASDLLRLRDIGYSHLAPGQRLLAVSPDARRIAFSMFRADPARNIYCEGIYLFDRTKSKVSQLDAGDDLILEAREIRGVKVDYGYPAVILPQWSPDGRWLAYAKRQGGLTQIWRVGAAGGVPEPVTRAAADVDRFVWSPTSDAIIFAIRPAEKEAERAIDAEGRSGFLFDDRIVPYSSSRPTVRLPLPEEVWRTSLTSMEVRRATDPEEERLSPRPPSDPAENMRTIRTPSGRRAWMARRDPGAYLSDVDLWADDTSGRSRRCPDPACVGSRILAIQQMWWSSDGRDVLFLKREGWGGSRYGLYRWRPGAARARPVLSTEDLLLGCEMTMQTLLCLREGSTQPRRLVAIDTHGGQQALLFDPNPEFAGIRLGAVRRLHWRSAAGAEVFGDLILPPDNRANAPLPLIVVQYLSSGFLRGGVGDEYPIQLFAQRGFAVLSFQAPPALPRWDGSKKSFQEAVAASSAGWATRRAIDDALESGVAILVDQHVADPARIGISGPSDGSTTVQYALIHHPTRYAAASISSCCIDPSSFMIYGGIGLATERAAWGFPPARGPGSGAWKPLSIALNASTIRTPLLMQLADHEYIASLDTFMMLRLARKPVEMFVFPTEYHLMWQPAHRAAAYRRNIDWFDFWLRGRENAAPLDPHQYARWRDLRVAGNDG